jgi:hypothetical protein
LQARADSRLCFNEHAHTVPGVSLRALVTRSLPAAAIIAAAIASGRPDAK